MGNSPYIVSLRIDAGRIRRPHILTHIHTRVRASFTTR